MKQPHQATPRRSTAARIQKRNQEGINQILNRHQRAAHQEDGETPLKENPGKLKLTFLGGLDDVGEKNMTVLEWQNDAIVLDCGNNLSVDLPGINYAINDPMYLLSIKHKVRGYVITHGHLDHIGGLKHLVPLVPAPIYGSRFSLGIVEKTFEDLASDAGNGYTPDLVVMNMDTHERRKIGAFSVELIRVAHALPEPAAICIDTPVGRVLATGDFKLDPEPLDHLPTDIQRFKELGKQGVLLLLSESSYADIAGRTPTEHSLQASFHEVIGHAEGRVFVSVFSSNINRIQMIINAAAASGRKVAFDGRSMLAYAEIAVRQGLLKIPKATMIAMRESPSISDDQLLVMCTGGQGEPRAALQRMSEGTHKYIKLKAGDTVVVSSSPIPGNEIRYDHISDNLAKLGVHLFRHPTHELDGCGPLHVSGHARRDELREMLEMANPLFFIPVHGGALRRRYHATIAVRAGYPKKSVFLPDNGDSLFVDQNGIQSAGRVPHGSLLVDQNGKVTSSVVVKDRLLLAEEGIVTVIMTIQKKTGQLLSSPDIISRGFIHMQTNEDLVQALRLELRRATQQRFTRIDLDRFKAELREHTARFLFDRTAQTPVVIVVVNVVSERPQPVRSRTQTSRDAEKTGSEFQRFEEMRNRLLKQN